MSGFWLSIGIALLVFFFYNLVQFFLIWSRADLLVAILEHIATEYSTKWFTLEKLIEQKFKRQDCENIVIRMLVVKILDSRDYESKEPNDFQETVIKIEGYSVFLDSSKLRPYLDLSEFRYVGPPPPRKRRKNRKLDWSTLIPQGAKPAYS